MTRARHGDRHAAGDAVDEYMRELARLVPDLTDEEWRAKDARVEAERRFRESQDHARAHPTPTARDPQDVHLEALRAREWPARALDDALAADVTLEACARMRAWHTNARAKRGACIAVLSGVEGCGKTVAAARWAISSGIVARYASSWDFARESRYGADAAMWKREAAFVLDDLGTEYIDARGSFFADFNALVSFHHADRRQLVITTNCTFAEFAARYGRRVLDRMRQCAEWIDVRSSSLRKAHATDKRMPWEDE